MHPTCALRVWKEIKGQPSIKASLGAGGGGGEAGGGEGDCAEDGELGSELGEANNTREGTPAVGTLAAAMIAAGGGGGASSSPADEERKMETSTKTTTRGGGGADDDDGGGWQEHGKRLYRAVIRAGKQLSKTPVDLEVEVEVFPEYPHRPPVFTLTLQRGIPPKPLPPSDVDVSRADDDDDVGTMRTTGTMGTGKATTAVVVVGDVPGDDGADVGDALNDLRLMEQEVNERCLSLVPPGAENETLGYQVVRLMQALDAATACERWGGANDEAAGVRQMRRGRERRKELPPLL